MTFFGGSRIGGGEDTGYVAPITNTVTDDETGETRSTVQQQPEPSQTEDIPTDTKSGFLGIFRTQEEREAKREAKKSENQ